MDAAPQVGEIVRRRNVGNMRRAFPSRLAIVTNVDTYQVTVQPYPPHPNSHTYYFGIQTFWKYFQRR